LNADNTALVNEINRLKEEKNAVILVHNYQPGEIQDIGDFVGDSLELSQIAAASKADVIVFCGVSFMAETASILCPDKKVLLPDLSAGCPMANMITAEQLRQKKQELPNAAVVCYINSTAEVKAETDICCTSANAIGVVSSLDNNRIIFVPDQYLGHYVSTKVPDKDYCLWPGYCPAHANIRAEHILKLKDEYPQARVMVHPECRPEVVELADAVLGTGGMCRYAQREDTCQFIIATEVGIIYRLQKENPGKQFIPALEQAVCADMKLITLDKVLHSLKTLTPEVRVPQDVRLKAKGAVDRMLEVA
jgi:quinolinate synthase